MVTISIDPDTCRRDGICVQVCPDAVFVRTDQESVPDPVHSELCISCGQCVAACPHDAITHSEFSEALIRTIGKADKPSYAQLMQLLQHRRSQRFFSGRPVKEEPIRQIIEAARFAPSALNAQSTKYLVVQDVVLLTAISENAAEYLKALIADLRKTHSETELSRDHAFTVISRKVSEVQDGSDLFLHSASALLIFYSEKHASMAGINANLAIQNAALAAETLGLGAFYPGFVLFAIRHDPKFKTMLGIPDDHEIHGCLGLGYPQITFKKWIERKPADISWR
ncbi:MAG: nitroreductase family protein [Methanoregula sp.]|nr:nitroreductase family protein [Methanoregula sp.]